MWTTKQPSSSANMAGGLPLRSPSGCPSFDGSLTPSSTGSSQEQRSIERWRRRPIGRRAPKLRYLDPDDPFGLPDLRVAMMRRSIAPVIVAVCVALALLGWVLMARTDKHVIDTAIGVARRD